MTSLAATSPGTTDTASTRLSGRGLTIARGVWLGVAALTVGLFVASVPVELAHLRTVCTASASACAQAGELTPARREQTAAALPTIIAGLKARGLTPVTVPQLLADGHFPQVSLAWASTLRGASR